MNFKGHLVSEIIIFLLLWGLIEKITLTSIILPIFWGTSFPDADLKFRSHRNIIFHSIILNSLILWYNWSLINVLLVLSVGIHLLGDVIPMIKKRQGYACVDVFGFKRFNALNSVLWYMGNILISIILFILYIGG